MQTETNDWCDKPGDQWLECVAAESKRVHLSTGSHAIRAREGGQVKRVAAERNAHQVRMRSEHAERLGVSLTFGGTRVVALRKAVVLASFDVENEVRRVLCTLVLAEVRDIGRVGAVSEGKLPR